jgi:hypothetical protein
LSSRISLLAVLSVTLVAALPSAASAAPSITFDHACYQNNGPTTSATFQAQGLPGGAVLAVSIDGQVIGQVTADYGGKAGPASVTVPPQMAPQETESTHELALTPAEGDAVRATFLASAIGADFSPTRGDPATMKVRFTAFGMNLVTKSSRVFLHYVAPNGKHRKTVALGTAQGACGRLQSSLRRLFPFRPQTGKWTLQLDTSKTYRKATSRTTSPWARIGVRVPRPVR